MEERENTFWATTSSLCQPKQKTVFYIRPKVLAEKREVGRSTSHASNPLLSPFMEAENPHHAGLSKERQCGIQNGSFQTVLASGTSQVMSSRLDSSHLSSTASALGFLLCFTARCLPPGPGPHSQNLLVDQRNIQVHCSPPSPSRVSQISFL